MPLPLSLYILIMNRAGVLFKGMNLIASRTGIWILDLVAKIRWQSTAYCLYAMHKMNDHKLERIEILLLNQINDFIHITRAFPSEKKKSLRKKKKQKKNVSLITKV